MAINVMLHGLWIPMSLLIAEAGLAEIIEAPRIKLSTVAQCSRVALPCRAAFDKNVAAIASLGKPDLGRCSDISVFSDSKLAHSGFTPTVHGTIIGYGK